MKKALLFWFTGLLILLLFSCKTAQPLQSTTDKESTDKEKISLNHSVNTNQAIIDSLKLYIGNHYKTGKPECDSVTQLAIENLLRSLNVSKQSGENSYELRFNEIRKQLELVMKIGQTRSESKDSIATRTITNNITKTVQVPVKLPLTWWEKTLIWTGGLLACYQIIRLSIFIKGKLPA